MTNGSANERSASGVRWLSRTPPVWLGCLVVLGVFMMARPYNGLRHDGILYLGQALLQLWPGVFSRDVFFQYGSQDAFSVASLLLSRLYLHVGLDVVHLVLPFIAQLALFAVAWQLMSALQPLERWLGLAAIASASHVYGGYAIFAFGERYLTGRTFAEPMTLWALALTQSSAPRRVLALPALLLAGAFHPLVTLSGAVVAWAYLVLEDRRWAWAGLIGLVPLAAAAMGVTPFDALLRTFDAEWFASVVKNSPHLFLSMWNRGDWQIVCFDMAVLAVAGWLLPEGVARLAKATLLASVTMLVLSFVLVDQVHNVLVTQLQPWRVLWIAHLLMIALGPALTMSLWRKAPGGRLAAMALVLAAAAVNAGWPMSWIFMGWAMGTAVLMHRGVVLSQAMHHLTMIATGVAAMALSVSAAAKLVRLSMQGNDVASSIQFMVMAAAMTPVLSVGVAAVLLRINLRNSRRVAAAVALTATFMLAVGIWHWDHRSEWSKYLESSLERTHPFAQRIPADAQVYWHEDLAASWAVLRRASYFSAPQAAGLVFNRGTAVDFAGRQKAFAKLLLQESICDFVDALKSVTEKPTGSDCHPTTEVVAEICKSESRLGYLVFKFPLERAVIDKWIFQPQTGKPTMYYLHDCIHLR